MKILGLLKKVVVDEFYYNISESAMVEVPRYFLLVLNDGIQWVIEVFTSYGVCASGVCGTAYPVVRARKLDEGENMPFTHRPRGQLLLTGTISSLERFDRESGKTYARYIPSEDDSDIIVTWENGDEFYPEGRAWVEEKYFEPLSRYSGKRPVWIFKGPSALGKTTVASAAACGGLRVLETDACMVLPDPIIDDIVVLGNKRAFTVEEIKEHLLGDPDVIIVNFDGTGIAQNEDVIDVGTQEMARGRTSQKAARYQSLRRRDNNDDE